MCGFQAKSLEYIKELVMYAAISADANIFVTLFLRLCQVSRPDEDHGNFRSGAPIGTLERMLMMTFVVLGQYEAIGFLIAAKSILRFSGTGNEGEKSEYVMTGTFISVAIALLLGLLVVRRCWVF